MLFWGMCLNLSHKRRAGSFAEEQRVQLPRSIGHWALLPLVLLPPAAVLGFFAWGSCGSNSSLKLCKTSICLRICFPCRIYHSTGNMLVCSRGLKQMAENRAYRIAFFPFVPEGT